jgi:hypothetical protein
MTEVDMKRDAAGVIFDMDSDVRRVHLLATAMRILAENGAVSDGLSKEECAALVEVAYDLISTVRDVDAAWNRAFDLTRPSRFRPMPKVSPSSSMRVVLKRLVTHWRSMLATPHPLDGKI